MKKLTYTTNLLHASLDGNVINYRLCNDGLESYWYIQGATNLYSAIDMGLFDAYEAMQNGNAELALELCNITEPIKRNVTDEVYYSFVYENNTIGAKWPSLSEAIKHVNLSYNPTGLASNANWTIHPEQINFRLVEDSSDFVKLYCNGQLMFALESSEEIKNMVAIIANFLGGTITIRFEDGIEKILITKGA